MGAVLLLMLSAAVADDLTARQIVERAHAAAGGQAWLAAGTNVMRGWATLCRDGDPQRCVHADRYEMYRVHPRQLEHGAHAGSGKFRMDAYAGDQLLFRIAFDGQRFYDQHGPLLPERHAHAVRHRSGNPCGAFCRMADAQGLPPAPVFGLLPDWRGLRAARSRAPLLRRLVSVGIRWTSAEIGRAVPDSLFVLGSSVESGR